MADELLDEAEIRIYTNGSRVDGQIKAAAILYRKDRDKPEKTLRYRLGSSTEHTPYEGKVMDAILGAWLLCREYVAGILLISMYTNSQTIIQGMDSRQPRLA